MKFGAAQRQPKLAPKNLQLWSGVLLVLLKPLPHEVARGAPGAHDRSGQTVRQRHDGREAGCGGRHQGRLAAKLPKLLVTGSS